ncbi:NADP-dependent oxidoreductase domain-containing protein [Papiliotrema laurentii]|uniref:NADP-dependent oxidoreductase domain-containing protein n=1 Tax=Papiliotrema laurentii TaxID=5418 RepID=A0AAD9FQW3_PAPLA|nr:NADP-dependent oxidoreductase domain-containing protein [Papiliotrema laurentii]
MDTILQAGLTLGMSSTAGFHMAKPKPPPKHLSGANVLPQEHCPTTRDRVPFPTYDKDRPVNASHLCIGAWPWGDRPTWHWSEDELGDVQAAWRKMYQAGINFIDTAQTYGNGRSEEIVGRLISGLPRDSVVVQTKYFPNPLGIENYIHPIEAPVNALRQTLERIKVDYVDIYLVHGPIHPQSTTSIAQGMAECVTSGMARAIGIANYDTQGMLEFKESLEEYGVPLATHQCEFSILRRWPELHNEISTCHANGVVFQGYSSIANGRLSGKYTTENPPPKTYRFSNYDMKDLEPTLDVLRAIARKRGKPVASVSLNYSVSKGAVPVVGIRNVQQAEEAIEAMGWRLSSEEMKEIDDVSAEGQETVLWQQG